jgi:7-keto-8-aminopelargonate synthetase-like enzyme
MIRSYAPGFIFTTSLPPPVVSAALTSVRHLKASSAERTGQQLGARELKKRLAELDIPAIPNPSHIVPVLIGDAEVIFFLLIYRLLNLFLMNSCLVSTFMYNQLIIQLLLVGKND